MQLFAFLSLPSVFVTWSNRSVTVEAKGSPGLLQAVQQRGVCSFHLPLPSVLRRSRGEWMYSNHLAEVNQTVNCIRGSARFASQAHPSVR